MAWGSAKEQTEEIEAGNMDTKNWQDKVQKILETTVSCSQCSQTTCILISKWQVEKYYMM